MNRICCHQTLGRDTQRVPQQPRKYRQYQHRLQGSGCEAAVPAPRTPPLAHSFRVTSCSWCPLLASWLVCTSSVGGLSLPLSQHNSSSPARVKKPGQEAPSRSAQWYSGFLPARLGACAGQGYLCLPVWVAGDGHPRPSCCTL